MAAVYKTGEAAEKGDRVEYVTTYDLPGFTRGTPAVVSEVVTKGLDHCVHLVGHWNKTYDAAHFKLISRKPSSPEPAPSSVGEWKKGPPTEPGDYFLDVQGKQYGTYRAEFVEVHDNFLWLDREHGDCLYATDILWHQPVIVPSPPPPVEKKVARWFTAKYCGHVAYGIEQPNGYRTWHYIDASQKAQYSFYDPSWGQTQTNVTDIEYIDT